MAADGASGAAGLAAAIKYGLWTKLAALVAAGAVGGLLIAAIDPVEAEPDPVKRRRLIVVQVIVAMIASTFGTAIVVRWLDSLLDFIDLATAPFELWAELAMPVGLLLGALSWGLLGMAARFNRLLRERGAREAARRLGIPTDTGPGAL